MGRTEMAMSLALGEMIKQVRGETPAEDIAILDTLAGTGTCRVTAWTYNTLDMAMVRFGSGRPAAFKRTDEVEPDPWQPLKGAPHNGTPILALWAGAMRNTIPSHRDPMVLRWCRLQPGALDAWNSTPAGFQVLHEHEDGWLWTPLPARPTLAESTTTTRPTFGLGLRRKLL